MKIMKSIFTLLIVGLLTININLHGQNNSRADEFTFVFMTDIHVQPERNAEEGFRKAIDAVNKLNPDLVVTGGDLIMDALGVRYERADSLYNIYTGMQKLFKMPVYNTIGNHEIFGMYEKSKVPRDHPEFGKKMYEKRIGKTYYSFTHKGVKFFILDSIEESPEGGKYLGLINEEQVEWIKKELSTTDKSTPIIISTHIPFVTVLTQLHKGSLVANDDGLVVGNSKDVLTLFKGYNLKLVLQGHLHIFEEINMINKIRFITAGAVSARWWRGPYEGTEEGFLIVKVKGEDITAEYFDYGWEVK
ncbi:MAG TPA: metallophosphoesterase [Ignavibacteriaceae bacterium]|nr:metallophosphoesterase [Ignavibacteriaceae bacterium]